MLTTQNYQRTPILSPLLILMNFSS